MILICMSICTCSCKANRLISCGNNLLQSCYGKIFTISWWNCCNKSCVCCCSQILGFHLHSPRFSLWKKNWHFLVHADAYYVFFSNMIWHDLVVVLPTGCSSSIAWTHGAMIKDKKKAHCDLGASEQGGIPQVAISIVHIMISNKHWQTITP